VKPTAILAAVLLVTAACGSSSTPVSPTSTTGSSPPVPPSPTPANFSAALSAMLGDLPTYITQALAQNQDLLPRNPQLASQLQAKIAMLQMPSLAADIRSASRWVESQARSRDGRSIPIVLIYPLESMRAEASLAVQTVEPVLPALETFYDRAFPTSVVRVWCGFVMGNTGGGGTIYTEDRLTYESRTGADRLPYDAILTHELGHTYMPNEALNQFVELYVYNLIRTGSNDPQQWVFTRSWRPGLSSNTGSAALLDVRQIIGNDAMLRAYRAIYPLQPAYGQPLSAAVVQAFLTQVPTPLQTQVSSKLATIIA